MGVRLPTILGKAIDDVTRTLNDQSSEEKIVDLVQCIERMDVLMQDLSGNQKLRPIIDDGEADVALWNKEIAKYFQGLSSSVYHVSYRIEDSPLGKDFMNAPWLFAEAYKYRRLREAFTVSKFWGDYDVFYRQKATASLPYLFKFINAVDFVSVTPSLAHQTPSLNCRCALLSPSLSPVNLRRQK